MAEQFNRKWTLIVGSGVDSFTLESGEPSLRVVFEVSKTELPWPNTARIEIYNLSPDHRASLAGQTAIPVHLEAGYEGGLGTVFFGVTRRAVSRHDGPDWITTLTGGDGELDKDGEIIAGKSIKKGWKRGTPIAAVIQDFAKALNVEAGNLAQISSAAALVNGPALAQGWAVDGPVLDEWIGLMRSVGLRWSIQDSALQLRPPEAPAGVAPLLSPMTGLIGQVERQTKKIKRSNVLTKKEEVQEVGAVTGKCLLRPDLVPGHQVILQSAEASGAFLVSSVRHSGDTRGNAWWTEFEALA